MRSEGGLDAQARAGHAPSRPARSDRTQGRDSSECAESSDMSAGGRVARSSFRVCSAWSTAAMTQPAWRCSTRAHVESVRAVGNLASLRQALAAQAAQRASQRNGNGAVATIARRADDRHRPHPLGDAWQGHRGERPPPPRTPTAACTSCSTGSSRTTSRCATGWARPARSFAPRPTPRSSPT